MHDQNQHLVCTEYRYEIVINVVADIGTRPLLFTRILTDVERRKIKAWLERDGEREVAVRKIAYLGKRDLPKIRSDLILLERFLVVYEKIRKD